MDGVYRFVWEKVSPEIIEKITSGAAKIAPSGGVVYENGKILTHLPLDKIQNAKNILAGGPLGIINTASNLANNMQLNKIQKDISSLLNLSKINIGVTICSSAMVVGAIVMATKYLSDKIEKVGIAVDKMSVLLDAVSKQTFINNIAEYKGNMLSLQPYTENDIHGDKINRNMLDKLTSSRSNLLTLAVDYMAEMERTPSQDYANNCYNFLNNVIEVLPLGMMMEYSLLCKLEDFNIADKYANQTYDIYKKLRLNMLKYSYDQKLKMIHGGQHLVEIQMDNLKSMNKICEHDFVAAIPQGVPTLNALIEKNDSKLYLPQS